MKQFNKFFIAFAFFAFSVSGIPLLAQLGEGDSTVSNPYEIYTKAHFEELADSVNNGINWSKNKYFIIMNNITDSIIIFKRNK
jgi:hypothetical protein